MCSFIIKPEESDSWEYFSYPECRYTTQEQFLIYYYTLKEKKFPLLQIRYIEDVSIITDTYKIELSDYSNIIGGLKIVNANKYKATRVNREMKPIPYLMEP